MSAVNSLVEKLESAREKANQNRGILIERKDLDWGDFNYVGYSGQDLFSCCEIANGHAKANAEFLALTVNHILQLCEIVKLQQAALESISVLNSIGPYDAIRAPRISEEALQMAEKIASGVK